MGTWGTGLYDDDHARDAVADLRESDDPNAHLKQAFLRFLSSTEEGFDKSQFAEDWSQARTILALCDVVRLGWEVPAVQKGESIPNTLVLWLKNGGFNPTPSVIELAGDCCRRLRESRWLEMDSPEFWRDAVAPLVAHFVRA